MDIKLFEEVRQHQQAVEKLRVQVIESTHRLNLDNKRLWYSTHGMQRQSVNFAHFKQLSGSYSEELTRKSTFGSRPLLIQIIHVWNQY